ncbi:hypothetical protein [Streptomyces sp. NPDC048659]|uniref:hypothetical protein n=1 Tax=Streptomyces sp. NPDC048659 TaxID=3155489 RepID=UPI003438B9A9
MTPLGAGTAAAAPAAAPAELVIPAERNPAPDAGQIPATGTTGFLRGGTETGVQWVPYDGSAPVPYANPGGDRLFGTGGDLIARLDTDRNQVDFTDVRGTTVSSVPIPAGQRFAALMGNEVVTHEYVEGAVVSVHALSVSGGTVKDRTVWGFRPGTTDIHVEEGDNPKGFFLSYRLDGQKRWTWVNSVTLGLRPVDNARALYAVGDYVFVVTTDLRLQIWDAGILGGPEPLYEREWTELDVPVGVVGNQVISGSILELNSWNTTLTASPVTGGPGRAVLEQVRGDIRMTPDGRLLAVRFGDDGSRTVHALRVDINGGAFHVDTVLRIPLVANLRHRVAVAQGELTTVDQIPWKPPTVRSTRLSVTDTVTAEPARDRGGDLFDACRRDEGCPVFTPTGDGRFVYQDNREALFALGRDGEMPGAPVAAEGVVGDVEASGRYVSFRSWNGAQKILDLDTRKTVYEGSRFTGRATSLDGSTFWWDGDTPGTVEAVDIGTGAALPPVKLADCHLADLQVRGGSAYWKCDGASGVTDLATKTTVTLPAHDTAVLGAGYVAHARDGALSLTPLRGPDTATRAIGRPVDARPGNGWAVDRFGGHLVWVDEQQRTHVVPSGVFTPTLSAIDTAQPVAVLDRKAPVPPTWSGKWWFSQPVSRWSVTFVSDSGTHQRTLQGWDDIRGALAVTWDGTDSAGQPMPDGVYRWTLTAEPVSGKVTQPLYLYGEVALTRLSSMASGRYQPVPPARVMDTRDGTGVTKRKVGPGDEVTLQVTGRGGVPDSTSISAVVLNVTATNPTASTYVSVYPYGTTRTSASNLNVVAGQTVPNLVVVPVKDGKVTFYNRSGSLDLLADVAGYYWPGETGSRYEPVAPARVMDTRDGTGVAKAKVGADKTVSLTVAGSGGVPAAGVTAVVLNVTATNPTASTFVSVYPYGTARTSASNLNVVAGQTVPNLVVVPVKDGKVTFYNRNGSVDLLADVAGYFTSGTFGSLYEAVAPTRVMDTRSGTGGVPKAKIGADKTVTLTVAGRAGVPAAGVTAVVLNVTATNPTASTFVSVYPYGTTRTSASNLNVVAGQTVPNLVVVPVEDGKVTFYNRNGSIDLLADVAGYFGP